METIRAAIYNVLEEQHPATCRSVFYQLVSLGVVEKREGEYKSTVCRLLVEMRRAGVIPFGWIADGTRWMRKTRSYSSIEDVLDESIASYRKSMWASQDLYVEVWCEKDAIAGTVLDATDNFDVPLMVSRGFSSITFLHTAGEAIRAQGKPTVIYHLGDHDPSGVDIARVVEKELRGFAPEVSITFKRLAVTPEQIAGLSLPTRPTKASDSRAWTFRGESVDIDAIPAPVLRSLIEDAIRSHIEPDAWNQFLEITETERESLRDFRRAWQLGTSS